MEILLISLFGALIALTGGAGGLFLGSMAGRRAAIDAELALRGEFKALHASMGNVASQCAEYMQGAQRAQARTTSERANIERRERVKAVNDTPQMSEADYKAHLARGGAIIPEVEAQLAPPAETS